MMDSVDSMKPAGRAKGSSLVRNLSYNICGQLLPLLVAAVSIPMLIRHIGTDRFGLLTIAWMVVGYFNLFDLGLGRALTKLVADRLGAGREIEVKPLVSTGLALMIALGMVGAIAVAFATPALTSVLHVPGRYRDETENAFYLLALSIPAVILTTGLRGVLEAYQRFDITNAVRTPLGLWTFGGPLCVLPFSTRLDWIVLSLVVGRMMSVSVYWYCTARQLKGRLIGAAIDRTLCRELLSFGGWMTVSNIISPLMVYMDRFFIGALLGTSAVAFYTTPYEVVFKLNIISEGLFGVLFPLMASRFAVDRSASDSMLALGSKLIAASLFPLVLGIVALAQPFLGAWVGPAFALHSALVMQLLAIGLFVNGFSKVAFNLIQAHGRADVTARLHMIELPVYVLALVLLTRHWGIVGAAGCWALRMVLDAGLLYWMSARVAHVRWRAIRSAIGLALGATILLIGLLFMREAIPRIALATAALLVSARVFWRGALSEADRHTLLRTVLKKP